jgi:hypothetical protein
MKIPVASTAVTIGSLAEVKSERPSFIILSDNSDNRIVSLTGTGFTKSTGPADKNTTLGDVAEMTALSLGNPGRYRADAQKIYCDCALVKRRVPI